MEYLLSPVIAALFGIATLRKVQLQDKKIKQLAERIETVEIETPKKVVASMMPVAQAVLKLNQTVGL